MTANFGATTYDWGVLHDIHADPVDDGDAEVAKLSRHAGLAVDMSYGLNASGSFDDWIAPALEDHFRYDSDAVLQGRDVNTMVEEIQWLRPLLLNGWNNNGEGHTWVVLGYNQGISPWQFAMNLGWGGGTAGTRSITCPLA